MKHENFNTGLSKQYLEYLGITNITEDGRIYKGDKELQGGLDNSGYMHLCLIDKDGKQRSILTHRAVYAWHHCYIPPRIQIDHVSGDRHDNSISNLRLATAKQNRANRHHDSGTYAMPCSMKHPRAYYEDLLNSALELPKGTTRNSRVSHLRAKLRYWDSHAEEREAYLAKQSDKTKLKELTTEAKRLAEARLRLKFCAKKYKELGNKERWHQMNKLAANAALVSIEKLEEISNKHFEALSKIV